MSLSINSLLVIWAAVGIVLVLVLLAVALIAFKHGKLRPRVTVRPRSVEGHRSP